MEVVVPNVADEFLDLVLQGVLIGAWNVEFRVLREKISNLLRAIYRGLLYLWVGYVRRYIDVHHSE